MRSIGGGYAQDRPRGRADGCSLDLMRRFFLAGVQTALLRLRQRNFSFYF